MNEAWKYRLGALRDSLLEVLLSWEPFAVSAVLLVQDLDQPRT